MLDIAEVKNRIKCLHEREAKSLLLIIYARLTVGENNINKEEAEKTLVNLIKFYEELPNG
ncbi:MAG: hypothetical protein LKI80_00105 [Sporolactobacillus sp.]|jgi:hypothetical protein|nr:hypothetical protein [Sporolactobacillus sp.]